MYNFTPEELKLISKYKDIHEQFSNYKKRLDQLHQDIKTMLNDTKNFEKWALKIDSVVNEKDLLAFEVKNLIKKLNNLRESEKNEDY